MKHLFVMIVALYAFSAHADSKKCSESYSSWVKTALENVRFPSTTVSSTNAEIFVNGSSTQAFVRIERTFKEDSPSAIDGFNLVIGKKCEIKQLNRFDGQLPPQ